MSEEMKKQLLEKILNGLEKQAFYDWYTDGDFLKYIGDCESGVTKEMILKDIEKLFHIS